MKTITMTQWRSEPGERITDICRDGASFLITKGGKPVARLLPVDDVTVIGRGGKIRGAIPLTMRRDLGSRY